MLIEGIDAGPSVLVLFELSILYGVTTLSGDQEDNPTEHRNQDVGIDVRMEKLSFQINVRKRGSTIGFGDAKDLRGQNSFRVVDHLLVGEEIP